MEEIKDLKDRTGYIEQVRLVKIEGDITVIRESLAENNLLTKQSVESTKNLDDTLRMVSNTMIKLDSKLDSSTNQIKIFGEKLDCFEDKVDKKFEATDEKIQKVKKETYRVDNKSKFELWGFIKNKAIPVLLTGGVIYGIVEIVKTVS